jgi:phasin
MTQQFNPQDFFAAAKDARIPENVQAFAEDSVAKTKEVYTKLNSTAKDNVKVLEDVLVASHAGAKSIGEKILRNTEANTEAAFAAASSIAKAKTLPEALRLQTNFVQQQFAVAGAQTKELFELSTKVYQQTFQLMNSAATKTFEQLKSSN